MPSKSVKMAVMLNKSIGQIVSFGFIPLTLICVFEVVMRYVFNKPTIWAWDLDQELFCFITVMGAGYTLGQKAHVRVDIFVERFSKKKQDIIEVITRCIFILATIMLLYETGRMATDSIASGEMSSTFWSHPLYPVKLAIVIGIFLLLVQGIADLVISLENVRKSGPAATGDP